MRGVDRGECRVLYVTVEDTKSVDRHLLLLFLSSSLSPSLLSPVSLSHPGSIDVHKMQCDRIQDLLAVNGIVLMLLNKSKSFF